MALTNAEKQKRHRERVKVKLAQMKANEGTEIIEHADIVRAILPIVDRENTRRQKASNASGRPTEPVTLRDALIDVATGLDRSGVRNEVARHLLTMMGLDDDGLLDEAEATLRRTESQKNLSRDPRSGII